MTLSIYQHFYRLFFSLFICLPHLRFYNCQERRPTISFITQPEVVADIGATVELRCSVQYASVYPVIWIRLDDGVGNDDLMISNSKSMILIDPRFSIEFEEASSTYVLRIQHVQETDAATYQCQVLIELFDKEIASVPLIVRRPPVISDNSTRSVVATEGRRVELRCYASGYPPPVISWRRQGNAILPTNTSIYIGNILVFPRVRKEHRGTYYCVATNVVGYGARRNMNVEVEFSPVISIPRNRLGQALQFDMDLECRIDAYPPPAIKWYKGNILLTNNQHYSISHFAHDDEFTNTILRVITIEKKQYSEYRCVAANKLGEDSGVVVLFETVVPICPPACDGYNYNSGVNYTTSRNILHWFTCFCLLFTMTFQRRL